MLITCIIILLLQVKGSWAINECIVPNLLQPNDSFTDLNAEPPFNVSWSIAVILALNISACFSMYADL